MIPSPITEIPDYVWRMKQPSYIPRPRRVEPKDTAAVFLGTDTFEFTIKKDLMGHTQNSVDMQSINLCGNFIFAIFIV